MKVKKFIRKTFSLIFYLAVIAGIFSFVGLYTLNKTLALDKEILSSINSNVAVYDNDDNHISSNYSLSSLFIKIDYLPQYTIDAFTSIEDDKFYSHDGLNYTRIAKAFLNNIKAGKIVEGASTISQQLIKNTHLNSDKTISRKVKEIVLTKKLENSYSKKEILELYLNAIYFGSGCYGIESASNFYFGKTSKDLNLNQSAVLAGLIKSPTYYSPIYYEENCTNRKNLVLKQMLKHGKITQEEYENNIKLKVETNISKVSHQDFSYINGALMEASKILKLDVSILQKEGYKIYTYYDDKYQQSLQKTLSNKDSHFSSMIVENESGKIKAFFSSIKYGASTLKRFPASTLKPILVYAPAIEKGWLYPCSIIKDEKTDFNGYSPNNIHDKYYGDISAKQALSLSLNVPAVKILNETGIRESKEFASKCGITFDNKDDSLALALGGMNYGCSITDLCTAYTSLYDGNKKDSTFIKKIVDIKGNIVYKHSIKRSKVMKESTAYLVGEMMQECAKTGTCKALSSLPFQTRAKSGTSKVSNSENNNSALCVGQTSKDTACVWFFSIDNQKQNTLTPKQTLALSPSVRVKEVFEQLYTSPPADFTKPDSVKSVKLDRLSLEQGKLELASDSTPERYIVYENFDKDNIVKDVSANFITAQASQLNINQVGEGINISFSAKPHQNYKIYKTLEDQSEKSTKLIFETKNKSGEVSYIDKDVIQNKTYSYYIESELNLENSKNLARSKEVIITYKKSNHNLDWFN